MITTASIQGPRYSQEDKFVSTAVPDGLLLAVMDGHGGVDAAKFVASRIVQAWGQIYPDIDTENKLRKLVFSLNEATSLLEAGSTLSVVFIPTGDKVAYLAILGDSPVVVRQPNGILHISPEHNVRTNQDEEQAAVLRGAFVSGGYMYASSPGMYMDYGGPGLQMTRALGDRALDSVLDRNPEVYSVPLGDFVFLATDGLFDPGHKADTREQAKTFAAMVDRGATAYDLVRSVRTPNDNITAILWKRDPESRIATLGRSIGNVAGSLVAAFA